MLPIEAGFYQQQNAKHRQRDTGHLFALQALAERKRTQYDGKNACACSTSDASPAGIPNLIAQKRNAN